MPVVVIGMKPVRKRVDQVPVNSNKKKRDTRPARGLKLQCGMLFFGILLFVGRMLSSNFTLPRNKTTVEFENAFVVDSMATMNDTSKETKQIKSGAQIATDSLQGLIFIWFYIFLVL